MKKSKVFKSPAKVNLFLCVIGEREDGYHYIKSLMTKISLFDELKISLKDGKGITIRCPKNKAIEGEGNLAYRAANIFMKNINIDVDIDINIDKNIPIGGGLGGGSSNAATVLLGLNELLDSHYSKGELAELGEGIGADVPFFIYDGAALVEGIGEKITVLENPPKLELVVLNPGYGISTASVYKMIKGGLTSSVTFDNKGASFSWNEVVLKSVNNDLEQFALKIRPELAELKRLLLGSGALRVLMSGSGSSFFGIYSGKREADEAYNDLGQQLRILGVAAGEIKAFRVTTLE